MFLSNRKLMIKDLVTCEKLTPVSHNFPNGTPERLFGLSSTGI